jgi:hypothetical protein
MNVEPELRILCPTPLRRFSAFYVVEQRRVIAARNPSRAVAAAGRIAAYLARSAARDDGHDPAGARVMLEVQQDQPNHRLAVRATIETHEPRTT